MFKVKIVNLNANKSWSANFPSQEEAQSWLNQQIGKPHRLPEQKIIKVADDGSESVEIIPAEFSYEITDIRKEMELQNAKIDAKKYLADTDWYVVRKMDIGIEIPDEIKQKRQQARELL